LSTANQKSDVPPAAVECPILCVEATKVKIKFPVSDEKRRCKSNAVAILNRLTVLHRAPTLIHSIALAQATFTPHDDRSISYN
jgi:hypothetical protein